MDKLKVFTYPQKSGRVRGVARIEIGDLKVYPIRIMESEKGLFIAMPQQMRKNGTWRDLFHPVTAEGRRFLQEKVLETYQSKQNGMREYDPPKEISFFAGVTPVLREKSTLVGFAHVD
ncbi:MAG: SpoVG family protein, partial [Bacteroidales bacterium]|nr:SpoVG family protein [Bacteroidales bacterium]